MGKCCLWTARQSRLFLRTGTWYRKWVGIIWRRFRQAPAAESRGRSAAPGRGPCPSPAQAATAVGGRCWTRWATAAVHCSLISAQNELYARHRQPHRGHRQVFGVDILHVSEEPQDAPFAHPLAVYLCPASRSLHQSRSRKAFGPASRWKDTYRFFKKH
ncbi:U6 snRNA-associated Sm-like protein LSm1 isoform X1 [Panthera leo]|uniref:U6 snRNA-associated Sm-like protein LSm1 isoform X1 n=1 Tax=Panthera leo TaxID=9689 RepID=UPI001C699E79|nr:U6 snRNA-associated Sm-like protein LSm1 isoform X1 [Panthera leo]XP_042790808.1 U6 snRNA-associated Sm-like protein LSm1 isoform X1 [Panthera leo]XP_060509573.1 U6 snRNA-associated Sm-like protein LSm1 isoform X1 [Panthera onca]XP_060509574.1 U6 snRNA-associated Sm-like protein LSm1 isoform X1 [Panthera onca]